jgi:hypothetical protein
MTERTGHTVRKATWTLAGLALAIIVMALIIATPAAAQDPGPIGGALATLSAATAQAQAARAAQQATRAAAEAIAIQQQAIARATAAAMSAEATRAAANVQATAQAQSAQATQGAIDELNRQRSATATAQVMSIEATRTAQEATATNQVQSAQTTATSQAVMMAAQATDTAHLSATNAQRRERFSLGLLVIELGMVAAALWVLWRLAQTLSAWADHLRPQDTLPLAGLVAAAATAGPSAGPVVIDAAPTPAQSAAHEQRMPDMVQVVDDPRMVEALDRWAERFDAEKETTYGDD